MGWNSTLLICNDCIGWIKDDKDFGKKVSDAISSLVYGEQVVISSGPAVNAATAVETHHADGTALIAVGGNCATVLSPYIWGYTHHKDEDKERILREFADKLGFRIVRKNKK